MTPSPIDLDVAIVGGGPGGLATALALTRAVKGIRVKVNVALLYILEVHYIFQYHFSVAVPRMADVFCPGARRNTLPCCPALEEQATDQISWLASRCLREQKGIDHLELE